jgi:NAD(P)-dependent dehydrogenase (short-subunit alcohol dehydrogenase family)
MEVSLLQKLTPKRKQQRNRITPRMCELRIMEVDGITASVVAPGLTVTPPVRQTFSSEILQKARDMRALERDEEVADLVGAVFFSPTPMRTLSPARRSPWTVGVI